jgi:hypothetical protein
MTDQISNLPLIPAFQIKDVFAVRKVIARLESIIILEVCRIVELQPNHHLYNNPDEFRNLINGLKMGDEFAPQCENLGWFAIEKIGQEKNFYQAIQAIWPGEIDQWEYFPKIGMEYARILIIPDFKYVQQALQKNEVPAVPNQPDEKTPPPVAPTLETPGGQSSETEKNSAEPTQPVVIRAPKEKVEPDEAQTPRPTPIEPKYVGLRLDGKIYILKKANTTGSTSIVWQTWMVSESFDHSNVRVLEPGATTRQELIRLAQTDQRYPDWEGGGVEMAVKIPYPNNEDKLEREAQALRRLGANVLRMTYPRQDRRDELWRADFPCVVMDWVTGTKLSESAAFSEPEGLEICQRLADLFYQIRSRAPEIVPTDSIKADGIFIAGSQGNFSVRIIDWNVYVEKESAFKELTLIRLGEVLMGIFAPAMELQVDRKANVVPFEKLAVGATGSTAAQQWDRLSYSTRNLIRRLLERNFEGDADRIVQTFRSLVEEQAQAWKNPDPLGQARRSQGPVRLNWLDIAYGKGLELSEVELEDRSRYLKDEIEVLMKDRRHVASGAELYRALRLYPGDPYYRWAFIANRAAQIAATTGQTQAYERLRLDETLAHLRSGHFIDAQAPLDWAATYLNSNQAIFPPETLDLISALRNRIRILVEAAGARTGLEERGRIQEAVATLARTAEWDRQALLSEDKILDGDDLACKKAIADLENAQDQYYKLYKQYEIGLKDASQLDEIRRNYFKRLLDYAQEMEAQGGSDKLDLWLAALERYNLAMSSYPDLWEKERAALEERRTQLYRRLSDRYVEMAQARLNNETWQIADAQVFLHQAMQYNAGNSAAAQLEMGLTYFQFADQALRRGELGPAQAYLEKAVQFVPAVEKRSEYLRNLIELFDRVDNGIKAIAAATEDIKALNTGLKNGKKIQSGLEEAKERSTQEPYWEMKIKEESGKLGTEIEAGVARLKALISADLTRWINSNRDIPEIESHIADIGEEDSELKRLLRAAKALEQARLYLKSVPPEPQKAEERLQTANQLLSGEPDQRLMQLRQEVADAWSAYLVGRWVSVYKKITAEREISDPTSGALSDPTAGTISSTIYMAIIEINQFKNLGQLVTADKTEKEVEQGFAWLGHVSDEHAAEKFANILAASQSDYINKAANKMDSLTSRAGAIIHQLSDQHASKGTINSSSATEMFAAAVDLVFNIVFEKFQSANLASEPALIAGATRFALRSTKVSNDFDMAVATVFTPPQAQVVLAGNQFPVPHPKRAHVEDDNLAIFLEKMGDTFPSYESVKQILASYSSLPTNAAGNYKPGPWYQNFALENVLAYWPVVVVMLVVITGFVVISQMMGPKPPADPTATLQVAASPTQVITKISPTYTATLTSTLSPTPLLTPTNTITPTHTATLTPIPATAKISCINFKNILMPNFVNMRDANFNNDQIKCTIQNIGSQKDKLSFKVFVVDDTDKRVEVETAKATPVPPNTLPPLTNGFTLSFFTDNYIPATNEFSLGELEPGKSVTILITVYCQLPDPQPCKETIFALDLFSALSGKEVPNSTIKLYNYKNIAAPAKATLFPTLSPATATATPTATPKP